MIRKIVLTAAAVGALSIGTAGIAGAASPLQPSVRVPAVSKHFNCAAAQKVLIRIEQDEAHIAAGLPKLTAAQQKAQLAGNTQRAARLQKRIARLESSTFKARLASASQKIESTCHVAAPSTSAS